MVQTGQEIQAKENKEPVKVFVESDLLACVQITGVVPE